MLRLPEFVFYLDSSKRLLQDPKFAYEMASAPGVAFGLVHRPLCDARVLKLHGHNGGHLESQTDGTMLMYGVIPSYKLLYPASGFF